MIRFMVVSASFQVALAKKIIVEKGIKSTRVRRN